MASLDILCFNPFNLKNKIMKIEHKKIFCGPSKILKNISWPINTCLKYFMAYTKTLRPPPPTYLMYGPLNRRKQNVRINNTHSMFQVLLSGVPLGSILKSVSFQYILKWSISLHYKNRLVKFCWWQYYNRSWKNYWKPYFYT